MQFKCQLCDKEFSSLSGLSNHLTRTEKIDKKDYYQKCPPLSPNILREYLIKQVLRRVIQKENGCIEWTGYRDKYNYGGYYGYRGSMSTKAHRLVYELFVGPIPDGILVCHHCDNSLCVNISHLYLGTNQDNMNDMKNRGRSLRGDRNPSKREEVRRKLRKTFVCTTPIGIEIITDNLREFCSVHNISYRTMIDGGGGKGWKCRRRNEQL